MVVGREIPAAGWTTGRAGSAPPRLLARERSVRAPNPPPPPDDVREEKHGVARTGATLRAREVKSSVASSASTRRRRPSGRTRRILRAPSAASADRTARAVRRLDSERDGHRLVVREHERRQPVAGTDAVPTPTPRCPPPECRAPGARRHSDGPCAGRSRADPRSPTREQGCAWSNSSSSRSRAVGVSTRGVNHDRGRDPPYLSVSVGVYDEEVQRDDGSEGTSDVHGLRLPDGQMERAQPASREAARRLRRVGRVRVAGGGEAASRGARQRGRLLHRLRRRLRGNVVPLLRPGHRALVDLLAR